MTLMTAERRNKLCRYSTRFALASERVQCNAAGQVVLKLKTPWREGTTHLVMSPLEFTQRLAALVPRPKLRLIRRVLATERQLCGIESRGLKHRCGPRTVDRFGDIDDRFSTATRIVVCPQAVAPVHW